ncbi:extracellular solute-binding protein [Paenibacillus qinlingensis]|uniref:extracellular solute-binding protein n=1 Tax=Paenibacillus qinlingensis TaxID=1837343 RepID=UPI00156518B1|nr:extracellular solute-binding protein [Paenibacillus qinlingensis]NQX59653.1 extracellular solute-binding protein [Paenibacillus qinlingensis]
MKRERKKVFVSLIALSMLAVGCSSNGGDNAQPSSSAGSTTATTASASPKNKNVKIVTVYNAAAETFKSGMELNNNPIFALHQQKSGYNPTFELLPKDDSKQKISLILASGDVPDWLPIGSKEDFYKLARQGAFMPLDDLIKKAPNYQKLLSKEELDVGRVDGKLYAFPYPNTTSLAKGLLLRTDLLTELNLKQPTTLDEYYQVFKTIKEKKGMIPFTFAAGGPEDIDTSLGSIAGAFGVSSRTVVKNGKLEFAYTQPEYKEFLTFMKKLYDEGLVDREFAVTKISNVKDKIIGGQAASADIAWWEAKTIADTLATKIPTAKTQYTTLPVGASGKSGIIQEAVTNRFSTIPKGAKNPEGMVEFLNYFSSPEALKLQDYGIEGTDYKVENGKVNQTVEQSTAIGWRILYQIMDTKENFQNRLAAKGFVPYYEPLTKNAQVKEETFYAPSIDAYDKKLTDLTTFKNENVVKFIMGARNLNEFDTFVKEFNSRGGTAAIDAMNEWYTKK